jgi:hypothetical protein
MAAAIAANSVLLPGREPQYTHREKQGFVMGVVS